MHRRAALLALAGLVVAASAATGSQVSVLWPDGGGHSHADHLQHAPLGFGATLVSYVNIGEAIGELDVKTDGTGKTWVLAALLGGGFAIVDGTDSANPVLVKKVTGGGAYGADAKLADDANTVYLSLQGSSGQSCMLADSPVVPPTVRKETCGIQVWDSTDKANPLFLFTIATSSSGSHMMDYEVLNGVPTIAMAAVGSPGGTPIAVVGANKVPVIVGRAGSAGTHDVTLTMDPLMPGRALALIPDGYSDTVSVWDVTVPALPIHLGSWLDPQRQYTHTAHLLVVEGKRVLALAEECFTGGSLVCSVWFLDATDFGAMTVLGKWSNPDGRTPSNFVRWSTHNFEVQDGKLYLGHYHGGLVVLDVDRLADLADPPMVANFLPAKPRVSGSFGSDVPNTWDAMPSGDVVWVADINTGLYAVRLA